MIIYYSLLNNTQRFVERLELPNARIESGLLMADEPFILITPTYSGGRPPKPVVNFLNNRQNRGLMTGVVGAGNRNFFEDFARAADTISVKCQVPVLHKFELMGNSKDVDTVRGLYGRHHEREV